MPRVNIELHGFSDMGNHRLTDWIMHDELFIRENAVHEIYQTSVVKGKDLRSFVRIVCDDKNKVPVLIDELRAIGLRTDIEVLILDEFHPAKK